MKKLLLVAASIIIGFMLFSFTQRTTEKNLITVRVYESCKSCMATAKIVVSGDGAEKLTPLEKWDLKNPEANTNLEMIRYTLRMYVLDGYKIAASSAVISGGQEITTYILTKE
jgi:hypothetical protein